jgi:hypothetical protein
MNIFKSFVVDPRFAELKIIGSMSTITISMAPRLAGSLERLMPSAYFFRISSGYFQALDGDQACSFNKGQPGSDDLHDARCTSERRRRSVLLQEGGGGIP